MYHPLLPCPALAPPCVLCCPCSYKHLHGKFVVHPVSQRRIPIIADAELVDMEFGTGGMGEGCVLRRVFCVGGGTDREGRRQRTSCRAATVPSLQRGAQTVWLTYARACVVLKDQH